MSNTASRYSSSSRKERWRSEELEKFWATDDLHVSPFRADGRTYGTPTWIWSVVVEGQLFVRAYHGRSSRWHQSALSQQAGRIQAAEKEFEVRFEPIEDEGLNAKIDDAYRDKYASSSYLGSMISKHARAATIRIKPA